MRVTDTADFTCCISVCVWCVHSGFHQFMLCPLSLTSPFLYNCNITVPFTYNFTDSLNVLFFPSYFLISVFLILVIEPQNQNGLHWKGLSKIIYSNSLPWAGTFICLWKETYLHMNLSMWLKKYEYPCDIVVNHINNNMPQLFLVKRLLLKGN